MAIPNMTAPTYPKMANGAVAGCPFSLGHLYHRRRCTRVSRLPSFAPWHSSSEAHPMFVLTSFDAFRPFSFATEATRVAWALALLGLGFGLAGSSCWPEYAAGLGFGAAGLGFGSAGLWLCRRWHDRLWLRLRLCEAWVECMLVPRAVVVDPHKPHCGTRTPWSAFPLWSRRSMWLPVSKSPRTCSWLGSTWVRRFKPLHSKSRVGNAQVVCLAVFVVVARCLESLACKSHF